ncbi:hypothetical protein B0H13DRAFT_75646 [Mycena leptocephala]|nr:hypothetical protein B0H13DRAFT_75646 [Mycena leptocephala]
MCPLGAHDWATWAIVVGPLAEKTRIEARLPVNSLLSASRRLSLCHSFAWWRQSVPVAPAEKTRIEARLPVNNSIATISLEKTSSAPFFCLYSIAIRLLPHCKLARPCRVILSTYLPPLHGRPRTIRHVMLAEVRHQVPFRAGPHPYAEGTYLTAASRLSTCNVTPSNRYLDITKHYSATLASVQLACSGTRHSEPRADANRSTGMRLAARVRTVLQKMIGSRHVQLRTNYPRGNRVDSCMQQARKPHGNLLLLSMDHVERVFISSAEARAFCCASLRLLVPSLTRRSTLPVLRRVVTFLAGTHALSIPGGPLCAHHAELHRHQIGPESRTTGFIRSGRGGGAVHRVLPQCDACCRRDSQHTAGDAETLEPRAPVDLNDCFFTAATGSWHLPNDRNSTPQSGGPNMRRDIDSATEKSTQLFENSNVPDVLSEELSGEEKILPVRFIYNSFISHRR